MDRKTRELRPQDVAWIETNAERGIELCEMYGTGRGQPLFVASLDRVFRLWKADEQPGRCTDKVVINGLGCLFGEMVAAEFGLQWRIVTDELGTRMALLHPASQWEAFPLDFVAKRVHSGDDGAFFQAMHDLMRSELYWKSGPVRTH